MPPAFAAEFFRNVPMALRGLVATDESGSGSMP
jgi:hypothetical protein